MHDYIMRQQIAERALETLDMGKLVGGERDRREIRL